MLEAVLLRLVWWNGWRSSKLMGMLEVEKWRREPDDGRLVEVWLG